MFSHSCLGMDLVVDTDRAVRTRLNKARSPTRCLVTRPLSSDHAAIPTRGCRRQALSPSSSGPVKRRRCCFWTWTWKRLGGRVRLRGDSRLWCFLLASGRGWSPWREINSPCSAAQAWPLRLPRAIHTTTTSTAAVGLFVQFAATAIHDGSHLSRDDKGVLLHRTYAILAAARGWGHIRAGASPSDLRCGELVRNTRRWTKSMHPSGRGEYWAKVYIVASYTLSLPSSLVFISISSLYFLSLRYRDSINSGSRPFASLLPTFVSPSHRSERLVRSTLFSPRPSVVSIS